MIRYELDDGVAIVRMDAPATRNGLTFDMVEQLRDTLDSVERDARAMILTGSGNAFCSGADLNGGLSYPVDDPADIDCGKPLETHMNPLMERLRTLSVPWISAVRGAAAGAGASLGLAGDMVIASETAVFLQAFSKLSLVPDAGSVHMLVRTIGRVRANELMLLGGKLPARQALEWGLVNRVVSDAELNEEAMRLARQLAQGPVSLAAIRRLSWDALDRSFSEMLWAERETQRTVGRSEDFQEGVAAFFEKRPPRFSGKRR